MKENKRLHGDASHRFTIDFDRDKDDYIIFVRGKTETKMDFYLTEDVNALLDLLLSATHGAKTKTNESLRNLLKIFITTSTS